MQKHRFYHLLAAACLLASISVAAPIRSGDGIVLINRDGPEYAAQNIPPAITSYAGAGLRLLVLRDDSIVFDHGLRDDDYQPRNPAGSSKNRPLFEGRTVTDAVELAPDGMTAILMETRIAPPNKDGRLEGDVGITWIDPGHPQGRWSIDLPAGRFVSHIHVLDRQAGFVLMTATPDGDGTDFTLYNESGGTEYHLDEVVGKVLDFRITRAAGFIGLDIAYPERPGLPDRTLLVLDRLQNAQWHYTWTYGGPAEPTDWTLMDNGVLEIRMPGETMRFDRTGTEIIPPNRKRRQKRVRD